MKTEMETYITMIRRELIAPWAGQPRRSFDAGRLEELAASMRAHGFLPSAPLLVRSAPAQGAATYEIIAGERRWRAAGLVGLELVPCVVSELTDAEALEISLLENIQRADLNPLEEADGIAALLALRRGPNEERYTVYSLAVRLGRSAQHLFRRVALRKLRGSAAGKALEDGQLPVSHAELIAALPSHALQDEVCAKALKPQYGPGPMPVTQLEQMSRDEDRRALRSATFSENDPALVPVELDETGARVGGGGVQPG